MSWLGAILDHAAEDLPGSPAAEYLASRGVDLTLAARFGLGYANPSRAIDAATPDWAKWAKRYWSGRLVFPLYDTLGNPIGMQTRSLIEKRYELFYAYPADLHPYVFGLPQALPAIWARGHAVLVEGAFDLLAIAPYCDCGIAQLRAKPSRTVMTFLTRYTRSVTSLLDMDEPGREGGMSLVRWAPTFRVSLPSYPAHDPAEWAANGGGPAIAKLLAHTSRSLVP